VKVAILFFSLCLPALADLAAGEQALKNGDYATAIKEFLALAKQGNAVAQFNLGLMYDDGYGVRQDYAEALRWYLKAAEQGDATTRTTSAAKAPGRAVLAIAAIRVFFQNVIEQLLTVVEVRLLEAGKRIGKVENAALRRAREKTQGSGDLESLSLGRHGTFAVVDENEFGAESHSQRKGRFFAIVQSVKRRIVAHGHRQYL
jgi:tetratricopeptide (TPR) repeat protein